jgi:hypothetical protein
MATNIPVEEFPYKTYLNVLHGPLEVIDVQKLYGQMVQPDALQGKRFSDQDGSRAGRVSLA